MRVDDIKATVRDYAVDKCTRHQIRILQRFFLHQYCKWLTQRFIAEITGGGSDHTKVRDAIVCVRANKRLFNISIELIKIFEIKIYNQARLVDQHADRNIIRH